MRKIAIILAANLLFSFGTAYFLIPSGMAVDAMTAPLGHQGEPYAGKMGLTFWAKQSMLNIV